MEQEIEEKPKYTVHLTLRITEQMYGELKRKTKTKRRMAQWIRQAIRNELDQTSQERLEKLPNRKLILEEMQKTRWYIVLLLMIVARVGSVLIKNLVNPPEHEKAHFEKSFSFAGLLHLSGADLGKYGNDLRDDIEEAVEAVELAAVRREELVDN